MLGKIKHFIHALRPIHWIKNLILFFPVFFGREFNADKFWIMLPVVIGFSLIASAIYCFNDLMDARIESELGTKTKSFEGGAVLVIVVPFLLTVGLLFIPFNLWAFPLIYIAINIGYSLKLKDVFLLDILLILAGYFIRLKLGGELAEVEVSFWLYSMTMIMATYILLFKRYHKQKSKTVRIAQQYHNLNYRRIINIISVVIIVGYLLYTVTPKNIAFIGSPLIIFSALPVAIGILRFNQINFKDKTVNTDPLKIIFSDTSMMVLLGMWLSFFILFLYVQN